MNYASPLLLLAVALAGAQAHDSAQVREPSATEHADRSTSFTVRPDKLDAGRRTLWGPTGELLPPVMATELLDGEDYFEWCLRWNKEQQTLAAQRAVAPRTVRGWVTNRSSYSTSNLGRGFFGRVRTGGRYFSTTRSREQVWQIGGYGGGPVTLYNPFVPAAAPKSEMASSK